MEDSLIDGEYKHAYMPITGWTIARLKLGQSGLWNNVCMWICQEMYITEDIELSEMIHLWEFLQEE